MSDGNTESFAQTATGQGIAQAIGEGAVATATILNGATIQITEALAKQLLEQQLKIELLPDLNEIFRIVREPIHVFGELSRSQDGTAGDYLAIPYVKERERMPDVQAVLLSELNQAGALLIQGRTGLGKTREVAQLLQTLTLAGWIAYLYNTHRMRLQLPKSLRIGRTQKVVLVFDNIHDAATDPEELHQWLEQLIEGFKKQVLPSDFRVIIAAKNEPQHLKNLRYDATSRLWGSFTVHELANFTQPGLDAVLAWLTETQRVPVVTAAISHMVAESDGTPAMLVERVRTARLSNSPLTLESWREMRLRDWSERFPMMCRQSKDTIPVLTSLLVFYGAGLPLMPRDVLDLSRRLGGSGAESLLSQLIDNRLIGRNSDTLEIFGAAQLAAGLAADARSLKDSWRLIVQTIESRNDRERVGQDLLSLARANALDGDLSAALEIATAVISNHDVNGQGYFSRGVFHLMLGNIDLGKQDLSKAIERRCTLADVHFLLGLAELMSQNPEPADLYFTRAMQDDQTKTAFRLARALARVSMGRPEQAEADLTTVIETDPTGHVPFMLRGSLRLLRSEDILALCDFDRAIQLGRQDSLVYMLRGVALRSHDLHAAESSLTAAIEHGGLDPTIYVLRGGVRSALQNQLGAVSDFSTAVSKGADRPNLLFARGVAHLQLRRYSEADSDFTEVIDFDASAARSYTMRAAARAGRRDWAGAEQDLTTAMALDKTTTDLLRRRSDMRWQMGRYAEAQEDMKRAFRLDTPAGD